MALRPSECPGSTVGVQMLLGAVKVVITRKAPPTVDRPTHPCSPDGLQTQLTGPKRSHHRVGAARSAGIDLQLEVLRKRRVRWESQRVGPRAPIRTIPFSSVS